MAILKNENATKGERGFFEHCSMYPVKKTNSEVCFAPVSAPGYAAKDSRKDYPKELIVYDCPGEKDTQIDWKNKVTFLTEKQTICMSKCTTAEELYWIAEIAKELGML